MRPEAGNVVDIATARRFRKERQDRQKTELETFVSVTDLHDYLAAGGHEEACAHLFSCDPWKYEPLLLDDLIRERSTANDPATIDRLRKLIRAGSIAKPNGGRPTRGEIIEDLDAVDERVTRDALHRIHEAERQSDAKTARELRHELSADERRFEAVYAAIREGLRGEAAEDATRTIENLHASLWIKLKGILAAHGLGLDEARTAPRTAHAVRPLISEMEHLRRLRDYLYLRRCYPGWARIEPFGGIA